MKLLDRYILKKYLGTYLFTVFALLLIIVAVDYTEKNDDFMEHQLTMGQIFGEFYLNFVPYLAVFLSPITIFISTILVTSNLASHTEIVAMLSSGMSFKRILWSYVKGAIVLGISIFLLQGWIIPKSNKIRVAFEMAYLKNVDFEGKNIHRRISSDTYAYLYSYNPRRQEGSKFCLEKMEGKDVVAKLTAETVKWDTTNGKWLVDEYVLRTFDPATQEEELIYGKGMDTTLPITPNDFQTQYKMNEQLTLPELDAHIEDMRIKGTEGVEVFEIEKYERYTYPFAVIILTCLAVIVSGRKSREGVGLQIVFGLILAFIYVIFLLVGRSFTMDQTIHPLLSAWIPNLVFIGISFILYKKLPK